MHEDYQLICEGVCNPDIKEYDEATPRLLKLEADRPVPSLPKVWTIPTWVRRLKHTTHIVIRDEMYDFRMGFCKEVVCAICGHHRKY